MAAATTARVNNTFNMPKVEVAGEGEFVPEISSPKLIACSAAIIGSIATSSETVKGSSSWAEIPVMLKVNAHKTNTAAQIREARTDNFSFPLQI
jgi:hypothetical protein